MFNRRLATVSIAAAIAAATAVPVVAQEMPKEINFGIISTESTQHLKKNWEMLLEDMQKHVGVKVNAFFAPDYAGIIEGMRFNKVQVASYGNKSGIEAVDRSSGEVFAQQVEKDGSPGYWSYLIVHKDSPLNSIEDVKRSAKNLTLGYGEPNSTSGFLVPGYYAMALNGLDPKTSFKQMRSANHEINLMTVANRQVDVATSNNHAIERLTRNVPDKAKEVKVIWKSPLIPANPVIWRKDLHPELQARIKSFFVSYGQDERQKESLKKIGIGGFKASDNNQLLPLRQLELFKAKLATERDDKMPADEKQAQLDEISRKLAALNQQMAALKK